MAPPPQSHRGAPGRGFERIACGAGRDATWASTRGTLGNIRVALADQLRFCAKLRSVSGTLSFRRSAHSPSLALVADLTIAPIPTLSAGGKFGQAITSSAKSGASCLKCAKNCARFRGSLLKVLAGSRLTTLEQRFCKPQVIGSNPIRGYEGLG